MAHALILDDDKPTRDALAEIVHQAGFDPSTAGSLGEARRLLERAPVDLALLDVELPDGQGLELLEELDQLPHVDVVVITGRATVDLAVRAFRSGVVDFITKPVEPKELRRLLAGARRTAALHDEVRELRHELRRLGRLGRLIGVCPPMQQVYDLVTKVAPTDGTVLVIGETGTGKELIAATVHELSKRRMSPYVPVNCAAIQPNLFESELFGHEKGAFTGADRARRGAFERAADGTLFLDEITEMPAELQAKLLRVLESREIVRVGGDRPIAIDARFIAATNRDPEQAVADGSLREDLFYRLMVLPVTLPPLRQRGHDVLLLAEHFLQQLNAQQQTDKRLSPALRDGLLAHDWPGNVRELRNVLEQAFILADDELEPPPTLAAALEGNERREARGAGKNVGVVVGQSIKEAERRLILATLEQLGGDKPAAAKTLGISLKTLYTRLKSYGE